MAKYVRAADEVEQWKETVEGVRNDKRLPARLILTDRRIVLVVDQVSLMAAPIVGPLIAWLLHLSAPPAVTHAIDREDFATIELQGRDMLIFRSKGEGYANISFVVYARTPFATWQQRMSQWVAGTLSASPLPKAKVVDRKAP